MIHAREPFVVAVDWGTSSLRLWVLAPDGTILAHRRSCEGMNQISTGGFETILRQHLAQFAEDLGITGWPEPVPVICCGMVGARQGWREAAYLTVPQKLEALIEAAIVLTPSGLDVRILPGLACDDPRHPDVMRGEETQLLGLICEEDAVSGWVCLPGTHTKWALLEHGEITTFTTAISGELFGLLSKHSILRHTIGQASASNEPSPAFRLGLSEGQSDPGKLVSTLFSLRARHLLFSQSEKEAADWLSGLLIGCETAAVLKDIGQATVVTLVTDDKFQALYTEAITAMEHEVRFFDADRAVCAGLFHAARHIWPALQTERVLFP
ncbi:2-dehydro-3-deoxygalactonokinase [Beijerinckia indica]|uniref:2-keto-3-deoxy-galactonokinase n=1 Tax=Beijerinckia indica subsp. indica (strain ATCC 9039 / DSM 1715 / NCIMB 8712) TaxID=395963 RepID=B2IKG1_BEII9|nr:2-dehydro-3-deoxygalactonokinase [Beijerinckia indica]ACB96441.1 2-keto-3-deoxy-galactonokinase [Beijerinckia indica subsp. indica ATCC 9039]